MVNLLAQLLVVIRKAMVKSQISVVPSQNSHFALGDSAGTMAHENETATLAGSATENKYTFHVLFSFCPLMSIQFCRLDMQSKSVESKLLFSLMSTTRASDFELGFIVIQNRCMYIYIYI